MNEPGTGVAELSQDRAGARVFWRLLDWLLFGALIGALLGVSQASRYVGTYGERWTYGALVYGLLWAFEGARYGAILGCSWHLTRHRNILVGVSAAVLVALAVFLVGRVVWLPLVFMILQAPEPFLATMHRSLQEAVREFSMPAYQALLLAVSIASVSYWTQRIFTKRAEQGRSSPAEDKHAASI